MIFLTFLGLSPMGVLFILIEFAIVFVVIQRQRKSAKETEDRINNFGGLMPEAEHLHLRKAFIPNSILAQTDLHQLIKDLRLYITYQPTFLDENNEEIGGIDIIEPLKAHTSDFERIRNALNMYLLKNKGGVADFHLVKDVVDRHTDSLEQEIQMTQSTPLYLGLMGTMLGVIVGLGLFVFNINFATPSVSSDALGASDSLSTMTGGINELLIGISIGMFASLYGLHLTVQKTAGAFKTAKSTMEARKNDFYTFIQTELLPVLSQNVTSSLHSLQLNLTHFNKDFTTNINTLSGLMTRNYDALRDQSRILDKLEDIDITEFAKANVTIFAELKKSMTQLGQFNTYLNQLNSFVGKADLLNNRVNDLLERADNFEDIAMTISDTVETNNELSRFLQSHFSEIESRGQLISDSVIKVDDVIARSIEKLKDSVNRNMDEMIRFSHDERQKMEKAMQDSRTSLSNLHHLADLSETLKKFHQSNQQFTTNINARLDRIDKQLVQVANPQPSLVERSITGIKGWLVPKK
jgi:hypothetical protein